jgi:Transposase/Helix-turn-helix domain of transposase family ISL3/zinc-finger of transposase IS204/IS1001/IS1096/IS1165
MFNVKRLAKEGDMRVVTAFKRILGLGRWASVIDVSFDAKGVIVTLRLPKRRRRVCSVCGQTGRHLEIVDYRTKTWRHLDLGANRCLLECELRRLRCPDCGVRYEAVRWARPGAPYTRDFEDVVAFLAQQMAKTPICRLMRIAWDSVGEIITRVVADHLSEARFYGLVLIGVDEIAYRRGQRYLTCVADHQRGAIVWAKPGRDAATLQEFFELLGDRRHSIRAISIDMSAGYENAIKAVAERDERFAPEVVFDPSTCASSPAARSTTSAAPTGTSTARATPRAGGGSSTSAGRCSKPPSAKPRRSLPAWPRSPTPTSGCTARSCSRKSSGCSTTSPTPPRQPSTSTRGWRGRHDPSSNRSSNSRERSANTVTPSSPPCGSG